jgi:hypothetical protein
MYQRTAGLVISLGRALKWDWAMKASKLDLSPPDYEFGDLPVAPVAAPDKTSFM